VLDALEEKVLARITDLRTARPILEEAQPALNAVESERLPQTSLALVSEYG
jgi:hypothetical protein